MLRLLVLMALLLGSQAAAARESATRVTVIVDAFGPDNGLARDWGYAALVEHGGRRILFDTGNDAGHFVENAARRGVALDRLDAIVVSHRHGDHTAGLRHAMALNPGVPVYVPDDEAFLDTTPAVFFSQPDPALPTDQRYFGGDLQAPRPHGTAWPGARFERVDGSREIAPGVRLVRTIATAGPFADTPEITLVLDTPRGRIVVVGCSHPGIETILGAVAGRDPNIALLAGGMHLVTADRKAIDALAVRLRDRWHVARIAPGHCTGELAFAALRRVFGRRFVRAGVGDAVVAAPG